MDAVDENKGVLKNVRNWYKGKHIKKYTILGCPHDNGEEEIWAIRNLLAQFLKVGA